MRFFINQRLPQENISVLSKNKLLINKEVNELKSELQKFKEAQEAEMRKKDEEEGNYKKVQSTLNCSFGIEIITYELRRRADLVNIHNLSERPCTVTVLLMLPAKQNNPVIVSIRNPDSLTDHFHTLQIIQRPAAGSDNRSDFFSIGIVDSQLVILLIGYVQIILIIESQVLGFVKGLILAFNH